MMYRLEGSLDGETWQEYGVPWNDGEMMPTFSHLPPFYRIVHVDDFTGAAKRGDTVCNVTRYTDAVDPISKDLAEISSRLDAIERRLPSRPEYSVTARLTRLEARQSDMAGQITFLRERLKFLEKLLVAERRGHADT